jgi:Leucine-rich repeat (LRR) protein
MKVIDFPDSISLGRIYIRRRHRYALDRDWPLANEDQWIGWGFGYGRIALPKLFDTLLSFKPRGFASSFLSIDQCVDELRQVDPLALQGFDISVNEPLRQRDLDTLSKLISLKCLSLSRCQIEGGLITLKTLSNLQMLIVNSDGDSLKQLFAAVPRITDLILTREQLAESDIAALSICNLQGISLAESDFSLNSSHGISKINSLRRVSLRNTSCTEADVVNLMLPSHLSFLDLSSCTIGDQCARAISRQCTELRTVILSETSVQDDGVHAISKLQNLRKLDIGYTSISDDLVDILSSLSNIQHLITTGASLSDRAAAQLSCLSTLRSVDLSERQVDRQTLDEMGRLSALNSVILSGAKLEPADIEGLVVSRSLRALWLNSTSITDRAFAPVSALKGLRMLNLEDNPISDISADIIANFADLRQLLLGNTRVGDRTCRILAGLHSLRSLDLGNTLITDAGIHSLKKLRKLEHLSIYGTSTSDQAIEALCCLRNLSVLDLRGSSISVSGGRAIEQALPFTDVLF